QDGRKFVPPTLPTFEISPNECNNKLYVDDSLDEICSCENMTNSDVNYVSNHEH
ncbi:hypothetical protein KI387_032065, partial [Taxus chinensis]